LTATRAAVGFACACACCAGIGAGAATEGPDLLERAAERALAYERDARRFTCTDVLRRATYGAGGEVRGENERRFALLLGAGAGGAGTVELRAPVDSGRTPTSERPDALESFPPVTSWLRLFHPDTRHVMSFDVGPAPGGDGPHRAIAFRGTVPFDRGDRFVEWEGTAWVDAATGDLVEVHAVPRAQPERLAHWIDRRNRRGLGINIFGFRFRVGPRARGHRVEARFGDFGDGFWLPRTARLETFEALGARNHLPTTTVTESLEDCRRFETSTGPEMVRP